MHLRSLIPIISLSRQSQISLFTSVIYKEIKFSTRSLSSLNDSPNWVSDNKLFRRHPRLLCLEKHCRSLRQLKQVLSYIFVLGLHRNPFVISRVLYLSLYELIGDIKMDSNFGVQVFNQIDKPSTFSWNTIIRFFAVSDDAESVLIALQYYTKMLSQGIFPDKYTFTFLLQACGSTSELGLVKQFHPHVVKHGFDQNSFVQNSLINGYLNCGFILDAWVLFDEMVDKDVVSWTTLISGLVTQGYYGEALNVFRKLVVDDLQTRPNVATMVSILSACGRLGSLDHAKCLHALLEKDGWMDNDVSIVNSLIDAYAKCGSLDSATKVFNSTPDYQRDLYTWTAMISGLAIHGRGMDAYRLFSKMEQVSGIVPDTITFLAILSACVHSGLVEEGLCIFEYIKARHGIQPNLKHYGCIIDLLGRAGMLERAYLVVETMPMKPNLSILGSLLSACRIHKNVDLGEVVSRKIESLGGSSAGAPVLLSNIYANENKWGEVIHARKEMRGEIQEKPPGKSWVQVKDKVHEFVVGDKNHPEAVELCMVLEGLERLAKMLPV